MDVNANAPTQRDLEYLRGNPALANKFDIQFGEGAAQKALSSQEEDGFQSPNEQDVAYLKAHPDLAEKFDTKFGEGASVSFLNPTPEAPPQEPPTISLEDAQGTIDNAGGLIPEIADAVAHGVQEAGNETIDAVEAFDIAASKKLDEWGIPSRLQITDQEGNLDVRLKTLAESEGDKDLLGGDPTIKGDAAELELVKEPVSQLGRFTSTTTQFIAGFLGARKVTGLKGVFGAFVNGAAADGVVFDPEDGNLSTFMDENEMAVPLLTEALAIDPDDPEWMNRMRNMAEGVVLGGALEITLKGLKGLAKGVKGAKSGDEAMIKEGEALVDEAAEEAKAALDEGVTIDEAPEVPVKETPLANPEAIKAAIADKDVVTPDQISESLWFNASKMDGPVEAQQMIEVAGDALARSGALEKLGLDQPQTFDMVIKDAKEELAGLTGGTLDEFTARVAAVGDQAVDQAKFLVSGKMALQSVGREVAKVAKQLDNMYGLGKIDPETEAKLLDLMQTHTNLQGHLKRVQTSAARAVSAGRINTADGIDSAAMDALERVKEAGGSDAIRRAAGQLKLAEGPHQQAALLRAMQRGSRANRAWKVTNEVFINSILSGWGTHAVNVASNMVNTMVLPAERMLGGALTLNKNEMRAGLEQYAALRSSVMDGVRLSSRVLKNESPVLDTQVKLDYQQEGFKAISAEALGTRSATGGSLVDGIGKVVRLPGRFLMAEDEFFKQVMFRSRLKGRLTVDASMLTPEQLKSMGYDSKGAFIEGETEAATLGIQSLEDQWDNLVLKGRVADDPETKAAFIKDNLGAANEGGSKYARDALRVAREATFTSPLAEGTVSHSWQKMANRHPYLRQITPFIQTPVNILNKAFDRTPGVNLLRKRYRDRLRSTDQSIRAEAVGEMATGMAIATSLYMLALEGRITGGGPTDSKQRQLWMNDKNWQPYSLNVGSNEKPEWIEFKRMDPYAFSFGIAGDMAEMIQAAQDDPSMDTAGVFAMLATSVSRNITSKTWLQGVSDAVEVLSSQDRPYVVQRWAENKLATFVPFSSAGRTHNLSEDEYLREARGYIDKLKMNVPGMSADIPVRYSWLDGKSIEQPTKLLGFLRVSQGEDDLVDQELRRLRYGFTGPDRRVGEVTLSTQQYQDWNRLMGTVKIGGKTLKAQLERAMKKGSYDLERERVPDGLSAPSESHRVTMLKGIITGYKQKSRAALFEEHPELYDAWRAFERFEAAVRQGKADAGDRENLLLKF